MGYTWYSEASIFTTEPLVIKKLIEEVCQVVIKDGDHYKTISEKESYYTSVWDLKIEKNTITFSSGGFGYFGIRMCWDDEETFVLFEHLFNNYDGTLVCHEVVGGCNDEEYCFSTSWVKQEGKIDWKNGEEKTYCIFTSTMAKTHDDIDDDFSAINVWYKYLDSESMPEALKEIIGVAKEKGFTDWHFEDDSEGFADGESEIISWEILMKLEKYLGEGYGELISDAYTEINEDIVYWEKYISSHIDIPKEFESLVEDFNSNN